MDKYVILQEDDYGLGIGYAFEHNGKQGRIAVIIKGEVNYEKLSNTFKYLHEALADLENPNIVWGNKMLIGNEVKYEDIIRKEEK